MKPKIAGYALRLPAPLKEEAERLAAGEGSSLNQFIVNAVAEKVASLGGLGAVSSDHRVDAEGGVESDVASESV
ncbi:MAG TPA: YlcI/YnfO family protein [Methylocystis sp.]|nr:YlcI/YnfO family protein [Methylocystis sp.]